MLIGKRSTLRLFVPFVILTNGAHSRFLLYPAFTPFIVVFIHTTSAFHPTPTAPSTDPSTSRTTTTTTSSDLALLHAVVRSLSDLRTVSPGATRLHDICAALLAVADILSESHNGPKAEYAGEPGRTDHGGDGADLGSTSSGKFAMTWPQSQSQVQGQDMLGTGGSGSMGGFEGMNGGDMSMGDMGDLGDLSDLDKLFGTWFGANRPMTDIFNAGFDFEGGGDMF